MPVLVDTSVWIDHFRARDPDLVVLLEQGRVAAHPFVLGELALGNLEQRGVVLEALRGLPRCILASDDEVMHLVEHHGLHGVGIGYVDAHLLASARLTPGAAVWTRDRRLAAASDRLGLSVNLPGAPLGR